ncbi:helix-turn-helix transcriptional regulator [Curtobacterium sp. MCSS17_007]|uniref:helix-turn-helix transcriptional regulator n=1 Tax=Curtobacterium sp. MCSS17_007 TaxID=2175646 RepID=UPI000DA6FE52|nr:helix-turn-helix transcriptional regulator [Curtobacterium sp. MCSS17_007]WIE75643.1 helix-turn-helix transcriptional regulator [Curtobacterium sp. MCSS17_007]
MSNVRTLGTESGPWRPEVRLEAAGTTPDEAMATLPGMYAGNHWHSTTTDGPYSYRYTAVGDAALTLRRSQVHGFLRGEVHVGGDDYVVHWLTAGSIVLDTLGDPLPLPSMRPALSPDGHELVFEATDFDARLVHLDRTLVHDVASERAGTAVRSLCLDVGRRPDPTALTAWRDALTAATAVLTDAEPAPLAWHEATRSVAAAFLSLFPPQEEELPPELLRPRSARIRAAVEFVHAHAGEPLTVEQIAAAAGLSVRSTQEGFRRLLGVTPMTYVHELRLRRVRAELLVAAPGSATVSAIARRWGFFHLGRFSGTYRQRFGETPKETLRR